MFATTTGSQYYLGIETYKIGQELFLKKDIGNNYNGEAIKAEIKSETTCDHVANYVNIVARGTHSAGYIYNSI